MTPQEAINNLKKYEHSLALPSEVIESVKLAIAALEKQIPKKPILKRFESVMHINKGDQPHEWKRIVSDDLACPICGRFVGEELTLPHRETKHRQQKKEYCEYCGQKIDWSESDE